MVRRRCFSSHTESPFTSRATPEMLPSPKRRPLGPFPAPPRGQTFSAYLWVWLTPMSSETAWDFHRSVWSAIVSRRDHQSPRRSAATTVSCPARRSSMIRKCFGRLRSVAHRRGRNVTPPELSLPGPSVTVRCRPTLAAYLSARRVRARISGRARPRPGRIRSLGVGRPHRLRLSRPHLRLTPNPTRKRGIPRLRVGLVHMRIRRGFYGST